MGDSEGRNRYSEQHFFLFIVISGVIIMTTGKCVLKEEELVQDKPLGEQQALFSPNEQQEAQRQKAYRT